MDRFTRVLEQANRDGYLTTDAALLEAMSEAEQASLRREWMENRVSLRMPYIEVQERPEDMALLTYNVKHIRIASKPARTLLKHVRGEIGKVQRRAGQANYCAVTETNAHVGSIGEVPRWVAIQMANEIIAMAPRRAGT